MHYAHNVGEGALIEICIYDHVYKISCTDIQIHLIHPAKSFAYLNETRDQDKNLPEIFRNHFEKIYSLERFRYIC